VLAFDSSLSDALETHSTESFWVLKLYYNAEGSSDFIGVSDQDRVDGSDTYYGVVSSWGGLRHSLDFFNFTTSLINMSLKLINTDNTIEGGRFSDLLSTYNFANRKWELFQNTGRAGTYDTSARMIGSGIISGDFSYGVKSISLKLLDYTSKYNKQLPTSTVTSATYPNAPEKNIGKPIPMAYGDFYAKTDIGTIPTSNFDRYKQFYKGAFPAIITDKWDVGVQGSEAKVDSQVLHTLDNENVYVYKDGHYSTLTGTIDATTNNPIVEFSGSSASVYIPLSSSGQGSGTITNSGSVTNPLNAVDGSFSTVTTIAVNGSVASDSRASISYAISKVNKLGDFTGISSLVKWGTVTSLTDTVDDYFQLAGVVTLPAITTNSEVKYNIAGMFTATEEESFDFEKNISFKLFTGTTDESVQIYETGAVIDFNIEGIEPHKITEQYEEIITGGIAIQTQFEEEEQGFTETIIRTRTKTVNTPSEVDYIYYSGKGRKYHSDIAGRTSYGTTDFYENPIYIIEDILRSELSLTDSEIDTSSFDTSGGTDIGNIFADSIADIKFAFSQNKFINSKDLINRICKQSLSWVFISGDGKYKIKTLEKSGWSANKTIDFNDCDVKSISRTSLGGVRNDITINYNKDYGQDQFLSSVNPTADATSKGTGVGGYNVSGGLKLKMDADTLDTTTATKLAEAYRDIFKDRRIIIDFDCGRAKYNDLEIGDIILFSNWDSGIKIYGASMGTDYYIVSSISKKPNGSSIKAIKVS
jgi:hypothetical protein